MTTNPLSESDRRVRLHLEQLLARFGGAIEFWTVACISQRELGNPRPFLAEQWDGLCGAVEELRNALSERPALHPAIREQAAGLAKACDDVRDVFETLADCMLVPVAELEGSLLKLNHLWADWRMRLALIGSLLPLPAPLPALTSEQENFHQENLDSLFDRYYAARQTLVPSIARENI